MQKLKQFYDSRWCTYTFFGLILTAIYFALYLPYLSQIPRIGVAEALYSKTALTFLQTGQFHHELAPGSGKDFFIFPFVLAPFFYILGSGLVVARLACVLIGAGVLWGLLHLLRELNINRLISAFIVLMFILSNTSYIVFRTCRPEVLVVALSVWSLVIYLKFLKNPVENWKLACSAALSALAILANPIGLLLWVYMGLFIAYASFKKRDFMPLFMWIVGSSLVGFIWSFVVFGIHQDTFNSFFSRVWAHKQVGHLLELMGKNAYRFMSSYSLGIKRIYILFFELGVLFAGCISFSRISLKRVRNVFLFFSVFGILYLIAGFMLFDPFLTRYYLLASLFVYISLARLISSAFGETRVNQVWILSVAIVLYLANTIGGHIYLIQHQRATTPYTTIVSFLHDEIPREVRVATTPFFWFGLKGNPVFLNTQKDGLNAQALQTFSPEYVVVSDTYMDTQSPITGDPSKFELPTSSMPSYYAMLEKTVLPQALLVASLPTNGYGTIKVYRLTSKGFQNR